MKRRFKNVLVVCRRNNPNSVATLMSLIQYLKKERCKVFTDRDTLKFLPQELGIPTVPLGKIRSCCELIAVVGGDGSFLSAARLAAVKHIPVIGVSRGGLGFLTDIAPDSMQKVGEILTGSFYQEKRPLLKVKLTNEAAQILAVNDVVMLSNTIGHIIEFSLYLNGNFLCKYRADGLTVATPTGSTAHALSGGGPIIHPDAKNILLVPMLSHNLSSRPLVIDSGASVEIKFEESNHTQLVVIFDGQNRTILSKGNKIKITKARENLILLHPKDYNYLDILRTKLHWERE